ncbi:ATP-binding mismatch repair protein [Neophaeococcomyces mojaviensis]|uniref:ATP-binding mismatch repair protein n=1 Tax=Neophaeococcomyces mojaviensis TaxID=3383035 RepID=A0ACC3A6B9_9EURO|nr:ATP-binding mismatch repair protein [Knufia sp. JES_112]
MAATIKPIEAKSVHQIQAGQVIVDLCSVVKELVENALDADATTIEVRFKNYGLDSIEVQDNGTGISEANHESLALKHYTSKLSTYDDLSELQTFGFRGEALSSLCALSSFTVNTAQAHEAPKGKRLQFETSGKLKSTSFIATQKGTTAIVENLFAKLPVRQKELSKNIKREYGKVLGLLHAYACISTEVKFTVKNTIPKARSAVVFSTKGNATTRDNIANVYGAKMLSQLIELDMKLDFQSTLTQLSRSDVDCTKVSVVGHISKPVFGEGRQTPDRQMFFVNGRPCGLPQIAKAINEVYKSYNVSQSPFIFADLKMDTNAYDVNVSPDKRTIFLHNATALTDKLKAALTERFDNIDQTVPQSEVQVMKMPAFHQGTVARSVSKCSDDSDTDSKSQIKFPARQGMNVREDIDPGGSEGEDEQDLTPNLLKAHFGNVASKREDEPQRKTTPDPMKLQKAAKQQAEKIAEAIRKQKHISSEMDEDDDMRHINDGPKRQELPKEAKNVDVHVQDFNARINEQQNNKSGDRQVVSREIDQEVSTAKRAQNDKGIVSNAFDRMRPRRLSPEIATITIGDRTVTRMIGTPKVDHSLGAHAKRSPNKPLSQFSQSLQKFDIDRDASSLSAYSGEPSKHESADGELDEANKSRYLDSSDTEDEIDGPRNNRQPDYEQRRLKSDADPVRNEASIPLNETTEKAQEEKRVQELIRRAEETKVKIGRDQRQATQALRRGVSKDSTVNYVAISSTNLDVLAEQSISLRSRDLEHFREKRHLAREESLVASEEERLSLTISKEDFGKMHIAGQFNLGFIIALRHKDMSDKTRHKDELFIIDQHASDEKYNFERLQAETVVGNQRLVHPVMLDLTAVEEEIVLENSHALQQNGFVIDADLSGEYPVGQRCQLMTLPLSKETTLGIRDLEELIHLLSETHITTDTASIPRPTKIRRMFAMRACRSSIMIGKTLSKRQMKKVLEHMGMIDKPWNCPHGRPTMRHLISLDDLDGQLWSEGSGLLSDEAEGRKPSTADIWKEYVA